MLIKYFVLFFFTQTSKSIDSSDPIQQLFGFCLFFQTKLYLVLQLLNLETFKVGQVGTNFTLLELLSPGRLFPLSNNLALFQSLLKNSLTSGTGKTLDNQVGQSKTGISQRLTNDTSSRTVDEGLNYIYTC